jgi:hypothetical protein
MSSGSPASSMKLMGQDGVMVAEGRTYDGLRYRQLATRAMVTAATELIIAWLHGDIVTDDTLVATLTATTLGAAGAV